MGSEVHLLVDSFVSANGGGEHTAECLTDSALPSGKSVQTTGSRGGDENADLLCQTTPSFWYILARSRAIRGERSGVRTRGVCEEVVFAHDLHMVPTPYREATSLKEPGQKLSWRRFPPVLALVEPSIPRCPVEALPCAHGHPRFPPDLRHLHSRFDRQPRSRHFGYAS